jgi:hypothetical protein
VETQELGKLATVLSIFMNTELDVLAKRLVELLEVVFVFRDFGEQIHALLDDVLADNFKNFVLLKGLARDVQR